MLLSRAVRPSGPAPAPVALLALAALLCLLILAPIGAAIAAPSAGSRVTAGARAETLDTTVLPLTVVDSADRQVEAFDAGSCPAARTAPATAFGNSATAVLTSALDARGVPYRVRYFDFGPPGPAPFFERIGDFDSGPPAQNCAYANAFWNFRTRTVRDGTVRIDSASTSTDGVEMAPGDEVVMVWQVGNEDPAVLDLVPSADKVPDGQSFTVRVTSYPDGGGAPAPARGATVAYGDRVATTGPDGTVTFLGEGSGTRFVQATQAGAIRAAGRPVCAYGSDPTACNLPPAKSEPPPAPTAPPTSGGGGGSPSPATISPVAAPDTVAPSSRFVRPVNGGRYVGLRGLRGETTPDRSDVARTGIALARRVGSRCAFLQPSKQYGAPTSCSSPVFLSARGQAFWFYGFTRSLAPGRYVAFSRGIDGAGNREIRFVPGAGRIAFTVVAPRRRAR